MNQTQNDILSYYAAPGLMTDPGTAGPMLDDLPGALPVLVQVVQNVLLHVFWAERYGVHLPEERKATLQVRSVAEKLRLFSLEDPRPLTATRQPGERQVGNCRDFSVLLAAFLQHQGIPARARCGFGAYFLPNHYEDHWVCEIWDAALGRWKLVDAQLDRLQQKELKLEFDPLDVPRNQFIVAGQAWQMCRQGQADPAQFGIFDMHGWWFIWGDLVRDFLSFNKIEILPWDWTPELSPHPLTDPLPEPGEELDFYDRIANLTVQGDQAFAAIRQEFSNNPCWKIPADWK